jgi:predicted DCC family thiol-disulfide oxidoreductase YuxK
VEAIVLYDADCGFCNWSLRRILAWDRRGRLRPIALQDPRADELLRGMDEDTKMASWHLVTRDGQVLSAGAAVPELLRLLPGGAPLARLAAVAPRATDRVYRWIAGHRSFFGSTLRLRAGPPPG